MEDHSAANAPARIHVEGEPEDPVVARIFATIRASGRQVRPSHRVLAAAPLILEANYNYAMTLRHGTKVARDLNELMILRTAQLEGGAYEFEAHRPMALGAGITEAQIAALTEWRSTDLFDPRQKAVLAYADALSERKEVPADIFEELSRLLDPQEIVELTMICGFYIAIARMSCGLGMEPAPQAGPK